MVETLASRNSYYQNPEHMARVIGEARSAYDRLVGTLGELGSEVRRDRVLERDKDIRPYRFVRRGTFEFVFPPQPTTIKEDNSRVIDPNPDYGLKSEDITYNYDPEKVKGHLRVEYQDADSYYNFSVTDLLEQSALPDAVREVIETTFKTTEDVHASDTSDSVRS